METFLSQFRRLAARNGGGRDDRVTTLGPTKEHGESSTKLSLPFSPFSLKCSNQQLPHQFVTRVIVLQFNR